MFHHDTPLVRKAHELRELLAHLTSALVAQDFEMASLDLTKLNANSDEITRIAAAAAAGDSAAIAAAKAQQLADDQSALDTAVASQASDLAPLTAQFPPAAPPTPLTVSPTAIASAAGATISQTLSVSGGTAPYTFVSNLADVTVDASGVVSGTPAAAETGEIIVSDSATPPASASVGVTIT